MRRFLTSLLFFVCSAPAVLWAMQPQDLYVATVPVVDYSDGERSRAIRQGLADTLVRLTGASDIASRPQVKALLDKAGSYVAEYGYTRMPGEDRGQALSVRYSQPGIDRFIRTQRLPVWPERRPQLLVWVLRESPGSAPGYVTRDDDDELYDALDRLFSHRGQPVTYPLYDLEDQLHLPAEEAWALNGEDIGRASARYQLQQWLVLRCYQSSSGAWRVAWMLNESEDSRARLENARGDSLDVLLEGIVDRSVDQLAANHVYIPSQSGDSLTLTISGVDSYASYGQMMALLGGVSMVRSIALESVDNDRVVLSLGVDGGQQSFVDAIGLYDNLVVDESSAVSGTALRAGWRTDRR